MEYIRKTLGDIVLTYDETLNHLIAFKNNYHLILSENDLINACVKHDSAMVNACMDCSSLDVASYYWCVENPEYLFKMFVPRETDSLMININDNYEYIEGIEGDNFIIRITYAQFEDYISSYFPEVYQQYDEKIDLEDGGFHTVFNSYEFVNSEEFDFYFRGMVGKILRGVDIKLTT